MSLPSCVRNWLPSVLRAVTLARTPPPPPPPPPPALELRGEECAEIGAGGGEQGGEVGRDRVLGLLEEASHRVADVARVVADAEARERCAVVLVVLKSEDVEERVGRVCGGDVSHVVVL